MTACSAQIATPEMAKNLLLGGRNEVNRWRKVSPAHPDIEMMITFPRRKPWRRSPSPNIVPFMASLRYMDEVGRVHVRSLDSEQFVIGRSPACELPIDSEMISREHLRIELDGAGRFRIRDLGSRNKTFVNGEQITETHLNAGDVIRAGDRVFEFLDESAPLQGMDRAFLTEGPEPADVEWFKIKAPLNLSAQQVEQLSQLCGDQSMLARAEDIADGALSVILHDVQAERGFIALRAPDSLELSSIAHRALKQFGGETQTPVPLSFVREAINQQSAGYYPKAGARLAAKGVLPVTAMVAPLTYRGEVTGIIYVDRPSSKKAFPPASASLLLAAGAHLGGQLAECLRRVARGAVREGAAWISTLRKMQSLLTLPLQVPEPVEVASERVSGKTRCGDFISIISTPRGCAVLLVDGGGHGVTGLAQAHAIESSIRTVLSEFPATLLNPGGMFESLNHMIAASPGRQTIACAFVGLDLMARKLTYINAGGAAPYLMLEPGRLAPLEQTSLVLGVDKGYRYEAATMDLPGSFRLVLCSDGVVEAINADGEALGDKRLREALESPTGFAPAPQIATMIGQLLSGHLGGSGDDDASWLVVAHK